MTRRLFFTLLVALLCLSGARNARAQSGAQGAQQIASLGDLKLQNGDAIRDFLIGYRTFGTLNSDKSNAILWPTWLGGRTEDLVPFVGPGRVVDTTKYFVILVDSIGNGLTTSPSNSKAQRWMSFPKFTIRDMVESERRLLTEVLQIKHLHAVMGVSMGGMQAFEWAVAYPDLMDEAIPMLGSPQSTSFDKLLWTVEIDVVELDPAWNHGHPTGSMDRGLRAAEEIDSMNLFTPEYRVKQTAASEFGPFVEKLRQNAGGDGGTASDFIRQREAIIAFDLPKEFGATMEQAARRLRAKLLVIVAGQDHMVNPAPAVRFASAIGAPVVTVDSPCGHESFRCVSVGPTVASFLDDPSSAKTLTFDDPNP